MKFRITAVILILLFPLKGQSSDWIYTVIKGDNLWNLSHKYLQQGSQWQQIQKINQLQNPDYLLPGTTIKFPLKWMKVAPVPAQINTFRGTAFVVRQASKMVDYAYTEMLIDIGDRLGTKDNSSAVIRLADGSELLLKANVSIVFDLLQAYGDTGMVDSRLRLLSGDMESSVRKSIGPGSRFEIGTQSVTAAVRGTRFRQKFDDETRVSSIEVLQGEILAKSNAAQQVELEQKSVSISIPKGFGVQVSPDQPLTEPVALLSAPVWLTTPETVQHPDNIVQWQPVAGAVLYVVDLFDIETQGLTEEFILNKNELIIPELLPGNYRMEVSAVDENQLQGDLLVAEFRLTPKPVIFIPRVNAEWAEEGVNISWNTAINHDLFEIQFSEEASFSNIYHREFVRGDVYLMPHRYKSYYVRVRSASYQPQDPVWSESQFVKELRTTGKAVFGWFTMIFLMLGL